LPLKNKLKDKEEYMKHKISTRMLALCSAVLIVLGLFLFYGCGGPAEQTAPTKAEVKELTLPHAEGGVSTTPLLKLTPDSAQISLVLPSLADGMDKLVQVAKRFYTAEEVDNWLQSQIQELANFADTPGANNLTEVAETRGFDVTKPAGIFADFKPTCDSLVAALEPPPAKPTEGTTSELQATTKQSAKLEEIDFSKVKQPNWAVMLGVKDKDKVEESLKELVVEIPEISATAPREIVVDGAKIIDYGPYAYSIAAQYVIVGSTSIVKGVASRFTTPYAIRYGNEIPATSYPEGVVLVKDWELATMISKVMPAITKLSPYAVMGQMKFNEWMELLDPGTQDPAYLCFSINPNEKIEIRTIMDLAKHPKSASVLGEAKPMQLTKLLPDNTQISLVYQLPNEYKTYLNQTAIPQLKTMLGDKKEIAQGLQYGVTAMGVLGNEIAVGVTSAMGDFPALVILIQAANVEQVKGLIDMLVPSMSDETYRDIPLKKLTVPSPVPIAMVMVEDKVAVSNNTDVLKKIVDLVLDKQSSTYMANLKPPLNPETPRYTVLSLQSKVFLDTIFPLMKIMGQDLGDAQQDVEKALSEIQELRILSEKKGNLLEGQAVLYLVPKTS